MDSATARQRPSANHKPVDILWESPAIGRCGRKTPLLADCAADAPRSPETAELPFEGQSSSDFCPQIFSLDSQRRDSQQAPFENRILTPFRRRSPPNIKPSKQPHFPTPRFSFVFPSLRKAINHASPTCQGKAKFPLISLFKNRPPRLASSKFSQFPSSGNLKRKP